MNTVETILLSPISWDIAGATTLLLVALVAILAVRRPVMALVSRLWLLPPQSQQPSQSDTSDNNPKPPKLGGMNATIAFTHRTVSQIIGLEMSSANLLAVFLSVTCAVAGAFILAFNYYQSVFIPIVAAFAMLILTVLIENITLSSLKSIRMANAEIQKQDDDYYQSIHDQLNSQFTEKVQQLSNQQSPQALTKAQVKDRQRAYKQEQYEQKALIKQKHDLVKQRTRRARRDRNASVPFAAVGICFSAVAGGLFWHQVLAGLDIRLNLAISTMFALAVSVTFILGELFKRVQDEAIKEAMGNNEMQQEMLKQQADDISMETMIETMHAVRIDPIAKQEMLEAMKTEFVKMIKMASEQSTKRLLNGSKTVSSEISQAVESDPINSRVVVSEKPRETVAKQEARNETETKQDILETVLEPEPTTPVTEETPIVEAVSAKSSKLGFIETMMYDKVVANLGSLSDLVSLSQSLSLKDFTLRLQRQFSGQASFLTEERVANVMSLVKQNYPGLFEETDVEIVAVNDQHNKVSQQAETEERETVSSLVSLQPRITIKLPSLFDENNSETDVCPDSDETKQERNTDQLRPIEKKSSIVSRMTSKKVTVGETEVVAKMRKLMNRNPNIDAMELAKKADITPQYARKIRKKILAEKSA